MSMKGLKRCHGRMGRTPQLHVPVLPVRYADDPPAGLFVGAGIPTGPRVNTFIACGCCGAYHRTDFTGDCREDSERYQELPNDAIIVDEDGGTRHV